MRAVLPHTALQEAVLPSRGPTGRFVGCGEREQPTFGKESVRPTPMESISANHFLPFTLCSRAVSIRSVRTHRSIQDQRSRISSTYLALSGIVADWVRCFCPSRIRFPASLGSTGVTPLQRYYGRSDSYPVGSSAYVSVNAVFSTGQVSLLHVPGLPDHSVPNHPTIPCPRFNTLPKSVTGLPP